MPLGRDIDHPLLYPRMIICVGPIFWHALRFVGWISFGIFYWRWSIQSGACESLFLHFSLFDVILYPISILEKALACRPLLESMQVLHLSPSPSPSTSLFYGLPFELREACVEHSSSLQGSILTMNSSPLKAGGYSREFPSPLQLWIYAYPCSFVGYRREARTRNHFRNVGSIWMRFWATSSLANIQFNLIPFVVDFHIQMIENSPLAT